MMTIETTMHFRSDSLYFNIDSISGGVYTFLNRLLLECFLIRTHYLLPSVVFHKKLSRKIRGANMLRRQ